MPKVLVLILGGGRGERLYPLTKERAKPAVPFGGKYRIVDIPISNCINSGFKQIYLITQFNSTSLHNHITNTFLFDSFSRGFVQILAADQTFESSAWYLGTADAVRRNFIHLCTQYPTHYIILSADQLYRLDLNDLFNQHLETGADITVSATPVTEDRVHALGILKVDHTGRITNFVEKPHSDEDISTLKIPANLRSNAPQAYRSKEYLASMGIYCFTASILEKALDNELTDFGSEIFPSCLDQFKVLAYQFYGFWADIGTIKSFYETNINLTSITPDFNFYNETLPIYTRRRDLPASKINFSTITETLAADGSIITNANIMHSVIGIRTIIESGASLDGVVCMGADFYETPEQKEKNRLDGIPDIGIGRGCLIRRAIIDKNSRIGDQCRIGIDNISREEGDYGSYYIRSGIIVIPKAAIIPSGTVI